MITRRSVLKYGLWGLAGAPLGCWSGSDTEETIAPAEFEAPKNCLFVVLDAATAGHFESWGYARETTPNIDRLAAGGFVFRNAFSQASATIPSVRSYFTGRYPNDKKKRLVAHDLTIAQAFQRNGFKTALFSENPYVTRAFGYHHGFGFFRSYFTYEALKQKKRLATDVELKSEKMYGDIRDWIASARKSPWFCYVHNLRPHSPYISPPPFAGHFSAGLPRGRANGSALTLKNLSKIATAEEAKYIAAIYDENLRYCDHLIGELLDWLESTGRLDDTLVVITSDHGEAFMQHGWLQHGTTVYDEMIHVPLVVRFPSSSGIAAGESSLQVELVDLFPTLTSVFEFPGIFEFDGESLLPLLAGSARSHKEHVFTLSPRKAHNSYAVRTADRKYILKMDETGKKTVSRELYDLKNDPGERWDLLLPGAVDEQFESLLANRFSGLLGAEEPLRVPAASPPSVDRSIRDALEALGYVE